MKDMRVKHLAVSVILAVFLALCSVNSSVPLYAATQQFDVRASVPQQNGFTVTVNRIQGVASTPSANAVSLSRVQGNTWTPSSSIDFGNLYFDSAKNIFLSNYYYAVDVEVLANLKNWSIAHDTTPILNANLPPDDMGYNTLDYNVNVTFVKQFDDTTGDQLKKKNYADSNGLVFTKDNLSGGWLRIYYGIATGEPGKDAPGASPIGLDKPTGRYQGEVILTLFGSV